jgi:type I restriction-modification system DNA methylase subunit
MYQYLIENKPYNQEGWQKSLQLLINDIGEEKFAKYSYARKVKELELVHLAGILADLAMYEKVKEQGQDTSLWDEPRRS